MKNKKKRKNENEKVNKKKELIEKLKMKHVFQES